MLQDVCIQDPSEHGVILGDPVPAGFKYVEGPARLTRGGGDGLLGGDDSTLEPADAERLADPEHRDALSRSLPDAVLALAARPR